MNALNAGRLRDILGPDAIVVEASEDIDYEVCLTLPDGRVVAFDHCGAYGYATRAKYDAFRAGAEFSESPIVKGAEWCDLGCEDSFRNLSRMLYGDSYHSGGNTWHTLFDRRDGKLVVFSEDGVCLYPSRWAWHNGDGEDCPWIDYADLWQGVKRTQAATPEAEEKAEDVDARRWAELIEERREDLLFCVMEAVAEEYQNDGGDGGSMSRILRSAQAATMRACSAVEEEFAICPLGKPGFFRLLLDAARACADSDDECRRDDEAE